ncbi:unnamed protein product [Amoebophrya sp. A25]|nr:unnamed protein product [Amoebophrya sp. A25]|eukprot:GSA25T00005873001.1
MSIVQQREMSSSLKERLEVACAGLFGRWEAVPGQRGDDPDPEHDEKFMDVSSDEVNFHGLQRRTNFVIKHTGRGPHPREAWKKLEITSPPEDGGGGGNAAACSITLETSLKEQIVIRYDPQHEVLGSDRLLVLFDYDPSMSPVEVVYVRSGSDAAVQSTTKTLNAVTAMRTMTTQGASRGRELDGREMTATRKQNREQCLLKRGCCG